MNPASSKSPKHLYLLVEFKSGVQLVSESWMVGDLYCWSPKNARDLAMSYDDAVRLHIKPTSKWAKYKICRHFGSYDDFGKAKVKLNKALLTSDLDTDCDDHFSQSKRNRLISDSEDDSNDGPIPKNASRISNCPSETAPTSSTNRNTGNQLLAIGDDTLLGNLMNDQRIEQIKAVVDQHTLLLDRTIGFLTRIDQRLNELSLSTNNNFDDGNNEWQLILPLKTTLDVTQAEELIKIEEKKNQLVRLLMKCGGNTIDDSIRRVLKEIFTNEVACEFSWKGRKGKQNLSSMQITAVMYASIKSVPGMTKEKYEHRLKEWFRHAPARLANEKKPQEPIP